MSFTFGTKPAVQAPAFGTQPAGSITFGTPVAQTGPRFGLSSSTFGQTSTPSSSLQWSATTAATAAQPNLFGTTTTSSAVPLFGTPTSKPLTLGAPLTTTTTATGGYGFGTPATSVAPVSSLSFGSTPASTGLSFGTPACAASVGFASTTSTASTTLSFGSQATQSGGLFATSNPTSGLNFATTSTTTNAPTLGLNFGTTTTAPTLSFGAVTSATTSGHINFNITTPAMTSSSLFTGLGGLKPTITTTNTSSVGLGGITTQQQPTTTTKTEIAPKDQTLPNEITQTVEQFKNFMKEQKTYSSEVSRCCVKEYWKMEESLDKLQKVVDSFEVELQKNRNLAEKLKQDTAKGLHDADVAHRTFNTPPGMQYDNVEPTKFFLELADEFEKKVQELKRQIEATNSHLKYMLNPTALTPEDLAVGMKRLYDSFIALAGGLQTIHNQVELQKEHYLNFRKYTLHDDRNIFARTPSQKVSLSSVQRNVNYLPPKIEYGPTPFNSVTSTSFALNSLQNPPPSYPGSAAQTSMPSFGTQPSTLFGSSTMFGQPSFQFNSPSYNFQLQKPPVGNKRGKQ